MENKELLLKAAFCCMACDGDIAAEEISLVKRMTSELQLFGGLDVEKKLNEFVYQINQTGFTFLLNFLNEVSNANLSESDELTLVRVAIATIEADNNVEYREVKFFKKIRALLSGSDEKIEKQYPDRDDLDTYLFPDIKDSEPLEFNVTFSQISL